MFQLTQSLSEFQYQQLISSLYYVQQEVVTDYKQFWMICGVFGITKADYIRALKQPCDVPPSVKLIKRILDQVDKNHGAQ